MAKQKPKAASDFEEMLMWTSYRYCIGRHTYVVSMASEIAEHYYNRLSDARKEFSADDIRTEINNHLRFTFPFEIELHRIYESDSNDELSAVLRFMESENVADEKDLLKYSRIEFNSHDGTYKFDLAGERNLKTYFSRMDINDLIPWLHLANCFDMKNHKIITTASGEKIEVFEGWVPKLKTVNADDGIHTYMETFGWESIWISVDDYIHGKSARYIPKDNDQIACVEGNGPMSEKEK